MKAIFFLFIIALSSCHVHYHIQEKETSNINKNGILQYTDGLPILGDMRISGENKGCDDKVYSSMWTTIETTKGLLFYPRDPVSGSNNISIGNGTNSIAIGRSALDLKSVCEERGHIMPDVVMTTLMYCESYTIDTDSTTILVHPACNYNRYTCNRCGEWVDEQQKERRKIIYKK